MCVSKRECVYIIVCKYVCACVWDVCESVCERVSEWVSVCVIIESILPACDLILTSATLRQKWEKYIVDDDIDDDVS